MRVKKLLVPTDFSKESLYALEMALNISKLSDVKIYLLHVFNPTFMQVMTSDSELEGSYEKSISEGIQQKLSNILYQYPNRGIYDYIIVGNILKEIINFAYEKDVDLIVMGSKGVSGFDEVVVGSNTEKVVRYSKIPVLTVKEKPNTESIKDLVFASNFEFLPTHILNDLKMYQQLFSAKIHFVKIITPNSFENTNDTIKNMKLFAKEYKFENYSVNYFNHDTVEEGIRAFGNFINADMLSLATQGKSGLVHLLFDSIAESVANHSKLPILTFNLS